MELVTEFSPGAAKEILFDLRGVPVRYDSATQQLVCGNKQAALPPLNGKVRLQLFVDRTSIDIFGNDGALYMPMGVIPPQANKSAAVSAVGGEAYLHLLEAYTLKSGWR